MESQAIQHENKNKIKLTYPS